MFVFETHMVNKMIPPLQLLENAKGIDILSEKYELIVDIQGSAIIKYQQQVVYTFNHAVTAKFWLLP